MAAEGEGVFNLQMKNAMDVITSYGNIDGAHHKDWVIDQVARHLLGDKYDAWVISLRGDLVDGEYEYEYEEGTPP